MRKRELIDLYRIMLEALRPNQFFERTRCVGLCVLITKLWATGRINYSEMEMLRDDLPRHRPRKLYGERLWFPAKDRYSRYCHILELVEKLKVGIRQHEKV